jgi:hypothetical protein
MLGAQSKKPGHPGFSLQMVFIEIGQVAVGAHPVGDWRSVNRNLSRFTKGGSGLLGSPSAYKPEEKLPDRDKPFERSR